MKEELVKLPTTLHQCKAEREVEEGPYVLARWAEPLSVGNDHQRRAKAGRVVSAVAGVT